MDFNVGDAVIIHKPEDTDEFPSWNHMMDMYDGMTAIIRTINDHCVKIKGCEYWFSYNWLETYYEDDEDIEVTDILQLL